MKQHGGAHNNRQHRDSIWRLYQRYTETEVKKSVRCRQIIDPSHKVDAKYAMQTVLTVDGKTISGVLIGQDDDNVTLMSNPEAKQPTVIPQDDIDVMIPSSVSMMPKALMDQYTKDEIFELMAYLESVSPN